MAGRVIGRLQAVYTPPGGWSVDKASRFQLKKLYERLAPLARGQPMAVKVTVEKITNPRTDQQNRLMWALLRIMSDHLSGGRTGSVSALDCYVDMLQRFGAKYEIYTVPRGAVKYLQVEHRVVQPIELVDDDRITVKIIEGSSQLSTAEMGQLIDGIFDTLAELGVDDPEITDYWREWKADDLPYVRGG